jgi:hypothetical protein
MTLVQLTPSKIMLGVECLKSETSTVLFDNLDASKEPLSQHQFLYTECIFGPLLVISRWNSFGKMVKVLA